MVKNQLLNKLNETLRGGKKAEIESALDELLATVASFPKELQTGVAVEIADLIYEHALDSYNKNDIFEITSRMADTGVVYDRFPESKEIALHLLDIIKGVLDLKYQMGAHDNLDIYIKDVSNIARTFPDSPDIGIECCLCYANLQGNCAKGWEGSLSMAGFIVDEMERISSRFPNNQKIGLIYCRSLCAVTSSLEDHPNKEFYQKNLKLLHNLVNERKFPIPPEVRYVLK